MKQIILKHKENKIHAHTHKDRCNFTRLYKYNYVIQRFQRYNLRTYVDLKYNIFVYNSNFINLKK